MDFQSSAQNIRVEGKNILVAELRCEDGEWREARVDLDEHLGNDDGHFQWGGRNFSDTAEDVHFAIEGGSNVPVLRAQLRDRNGNYQPRDVNLGERVSNANGYFHFQY
ncbi:Cyanovirin-N [Aspergillus caelatus]|uniref:Cyanovirin-N n=2 Tax=Aspergillus subgen. Circumdati TaxID=2720871 RepID=A0A5N7AG65_9EURO|nr:Cyanovirin-N [Aspergillus caelatus]KAE8368822.1 Cyanovirin-N [Aspergillus caelatus]KAE8419419.1 Cyanovirin-N [Aspergillus pseudocaelatus]